MNAKFIATVICLAVNIAIISAMPGGKYYPCRDTTKDVFSFNNYSRDWCFLIPPLLIGQCSLFMIADPQTAYQLVLIVRIIV